MNDNKGNGMWYFTWILGVSFAVMLASGLAMMYENQEQDESQS